MNGARFLAVFLGAAACSPAVAPQPPLAGATIGGPFALVDQAGHRVTNRSFAGRYRIMVFGYTSCPDVCPADLQTLGAAMRLLETSDPARAKRVVPIFVTVDPQRDTVLAPYVAAFDPHMIGLTGSPQEIARVAKEYRVFYRAEPADAAGNYVVQHSDQALLFGPDGKPIAILPVADGAQAVADTLEKWVA